MSLAEKLREKTARAENWASQVQEELVDFVVGGKTIFSYTGLGVVPAMINHMILRVLVQDPSYNIAPATDVALHIAPYRETEYRILLYTYSPWERGEIARLADALYIMGVPLKFVLAEPEDPVVQEKVAEEDTVPVPRGVDPLLAQTLLAARVGVEAAKRITGRGDMRIKRLEEEVGDITSVVEELSKTYEDLGKRVAELVKNHDGRGVLVLSTTSMMPAALVVARAITGLGVPAPVMNVTLGTTMMPRGAPVLIVHSSTEGDVAREAWFRASMGGAKKIERLEVRTDPLSAPVYGVILAELVRMELESLVKASQDSQ